MMNPIHNFSFSDLELRQTAFRGGYALYQENANLCMPKVMLIRALYEFTKSRFLLDGTLTLPLELKNMGSRSSVTKVVQSSVSLNIDSYLRSYKI